MPKIRMLSAAFISFIKRVFSEKGKAKKADSSQENKADSSSIRWGLDRDTILFLSLLGLLTGLAAPGIGLWPIAWLGLAPAFLWIQRTRKNLNSIQGYTGTFLGGLLFGIFYHLVYFQWFVGLHPLDWMDLNTPISLTVTALSWVGLFPLHGALLFGLFFAALHFLRRHSSDILVALLFPLLWSFGSQTFPLIDELYCNWGLLTYTQAGIPYLLDLAGQVGTSGIEYILITHNLLVAFTLNHSIERHYKDPKLSREPYHSIVMATALPLLMALSMLNPSQPSDTADISIPLAAIQGQLGIAEIRSDIDAESERKASERAYLKPLETSNFPKNTLVVLPEEGIIPDWVNENHPLQLPTMKRLQHVAQNKTYFIASGMSTFKRSHHRGDNGLNKRIYHNSIGFFSPDKGFFSFYVKEHLVPFGEADPTFHGLLQDGWMQVALSWIGVDFVNIYSTGHHNLPTPLNITTADNRKKQILVGPMVCMELVFPEYAARHKANGANILITAGNLGWFNQHPLIAEQFIAIGQFRAAENQLPLVIAENTGGSAIISRRGRILKRSRPGSKQTTLLVTPRALSPTLSPKPTPQTRTEKIVKE